MFDTDMYNTNNNFFNFRNLGGLIVNKMQDIPYDFYAMIPTHLQPFYREMLRERQWEGGYVKGVHEKLLSSRIVSAITQAITDKITGSGFKFDGDDLRTAILNRWRDVMDFDSAIDLLAQNASVLGFDFLKVDWLNGIPIPTVVPADQIFYIMRNKIIVDAKIVVAFSISNEKTSNNKYLMEHRYFDKENKPMIRHFFTDTTSQFDENASTLKDFRKERGLNITPELLKSFGIEVKIGQNFKEILKSLGIYIEPQPLPSRNGLAIEMVKATVQNPTYIKSGLGQGIVAQMGEDNLIKYEIACSLQSHELNIAPQIVLVPQGLNNGRLNDPFNQNQLNIGNAPERIADTYFVKYQYADEESGEIKIVEMHIRSNEIISMKGSALKDCLINIGLTPKDFSLEIDKSVYTSTEELKYGDISARMIERRRRLMNSALMMVTDEVLNAFGLDSVGIKILWTDDAVNDFENQIRSYSMAVQNFLMSPEEAVRRLYPNKTNSEINKLLQEIQRNRQNIVDTYYGGNNQNNTIKKVDSGNDNQKTNK